MHGGCRNLVRRHGADERRADGHLVPAGRLTQSASSNPPRPGFALRFRPGRTSNGGPMQPTRLPRKKDVALELLEHATVFVHLDPRAEAVRVPPWFKRQPQLVLQVGLNMAVPIPDLEVDDEGLSCTLSFNRSPFLCVIPWSSVFALVDDRRQGMVWPDDVPPELNQQAQQQAKPAAARAELKVAPAPADAKATGPTGVTEGKATPKRRARKTAAAKAEP